jgi:hypothetical protein
MRKNQMTFLKQVTGQTGQYSSESLATELSATFGRQSGADAIALATKSGDEGALSSLRASFESLKVTAKQLYGQDISDTRVLAGAAGAMLASSQESYMAYLQNPLAGEAAAGVKMLDTGVTAVAVDADRMRYAKEAYDTNNSRSMMAMTAQFNIAATGQDTFNQAFWELTLLEPSQAIATITTHVLHIVKDAQHRNDLSARENWGDLNILAARVVAGVLDNQSLDLIPVFIETGAPETQTKQYFVDKTKIAPTQTLVAGAEVSTSYLKFGARVQSYMALATPASILKEGVLDLTDTIDGAISLSDVAYEIDGKVVAFGNLSNRGGTALMPAMTGDSERLILNMDSTFAIAANTKDIAGTAIAGLSFLGQNVLHVRAAVNGSVIRDRATITFDASELTVDTITDVNGDVVAPSSTMYADAAALLAASTKLGYKLKARRSNTNARVRGIPLQERAYTTGITVPRRTPISVISSATSTEINAEQEINRATSNLAAAVKAQCDAQGVTSLLDYFEQLKAYVGSGRARAYDFDSSDTLGVARLLVQPHVIDLNVNLADVVATLNSSDKPEDVQAFLLTNIRQAALELRRTGRLQAAYDMQYPAESVKPTVVIGTDNVISNWLVKDGDPRTFGADMEFKVADTQLQDMKDTIVIGFRDPKNPQESVLQTGRLFYAPEVVTNANIQRNGAFNRETTVHPRFSHVPMLPLLARIKITGLTDFFATRVPVSTQVV